MTKKRFSYIVADYFQKRNTHPVTLLFKNFQVDDAFLINLDKTVQEKFTNNNGIQIQNTKLVEGDYWSGILIEFNQDEFETVDSTNWQAMKNSETLHSQLQNLYDSFAETDTRIIGLSTGSSVYSVAALETLGENYFKTPTDIYNGPSIN